MSVFPFTVKSFDSFTDKEDILRTSWDIVTLGEFTLPGISEVDISRARKIIIKNAKDKSYASSKDSGIELAKITIKNTITTPEQQEVLEDILKYYDTQLGLKSGNKKTTGELLGFPITHPACQMRGISSVLIEDIDGPKALRPGYMYTTFKCIEVRKPIKTETKKVDPGPDIAIGSAFNPLQPTPPSKDSKVTGPKTKPKK